MKPRSTNLKNLIALFFAVTTISGFAADLEEYPGCTFIETEWADGDSFQVRFPDRSKKVVRLYYVDCIETLASSATDARRVREQSRYFGISDHTTTVDYGKKGAAFTRKVLEKPFTVHTALAKAPGRSGSQRYYAFITTSEGKDLGELLIENGLARSKGIGRETPDGTHRDDQEEHLDDLELRSALSRQGIWKHSNPDDIVHMRKEERDEMRALEAIDDALATAPPEAPIDLNSASLEELVSTGLREKIADLVIQERPFLSVDDIIRVRGIGPGTLADVREHLKVVEEK